MNGRMEVTGVRDAADLAGNRGNAPGPNDTPPEGMVPQKALDERVRTFREREEAQQAVIASLQAENAQIRAANAQLTTTQPQPAPASERPLTRVELDEAVEQDKITPQQRDAYLAKVQEQRTEQQIKERVDVETAAMQRKLVLDGMIQGYVRANPKLAQQGSEELTKVHAKVAELVARGQGANDLSTQALALELIYGPLSEVKEITKDTRQTDAPGGAGGGDDLPAAGGAPRGLYPQERAGYEQLIGKGRYKGWDDPVLVKELSYLKLDER